ncbi:hypothetical protein B484DRAFT_310327, partial [Ochromonadaceae sp. CCMP2298]
DTYAASLIHVNRLYSRAFGAESRKVPAHVPHMIDTQYVQEMQDRWPMEWNATSAHRFRSPEDMQYSFSYYYYLIHRLKNKPPSVDQYLASVVDTDRDGLLSDNEFRTLAAVRNSTYTAQHSAASSSSALGLRSFTLRPPPSLQQVLNCSDITTALRKNVDWDAQFPTHSLLSDRDLVAFEMVGDNYTATLGQLDSIRARQSKFVCINDNM